MYELEMEFEVPLIKRRDNRTGRYMRGAIITGSFTFSADGKIEDIWVPNEAHDDTRKWVELRTDDALYPLVLERLYEEYEDLMLDRINELPPPRLSLGSEAWRHAAE